MDVPLPHVPARLKHWSEPALDGWWERKGDRRWARRRFYPYPARRECQNLFRAGLRTGEWHAHLHAVERCLPVRSTVAWVRSETSLTVAGAVPALLFEQRTGFPFHPLELGRGDTWNRRTVAVGGQRGKRPDVWMARFAGNPPRSRLIVANSNVLECLP